MKTKESLTDKFKTLVAGATLMAGIAMGTGCGGAEQINKVPSEDVVNDNDEINNNETNDQDGKPINNNDSDDVIDDKDPINHNDSDDIIDDNDPINHNDSDDVIDDNDPINHNDSDDVIDDNDNNPSENDDSDNTNDSNRFFASECAEKKKYLENLTPDQIEAKKDEWHEEPKNSCPYNYIRQPEIYDEKTDCMYIVDRCEGNLEEPMWLENAAPKIIFDLYGVPPPIRYGIVSTTFNYSANGSQSNIKIRVPMLIMDVNFVSQNCLSQGDENTSIIEMTPNATDLSAGCRIDGEDRAPPIETKSAKQTRTPLPEYTSLCKSMPNYQIDKYNNACSTTINEFVWLENVASKLLLPQTSEFWHNYAVAIKSITRDLDTGVFYMTMQIGSDPTYAMTVNITLNNAKSCIDQCHGKEGCTSHIEPTSQDASKGCFINGVEVNGEESAQRLPMKQHNLKYKTAPRFIKPAPAVAKQNYAKNLRPNRQKWLAQNVRNFGRNGR